MDIIEDICAGDAVREVLAEMPTHRRAEMLAYYEQSAIRHADLDMLREVRAFQKAARLTDGQI